jgi:flagellar basal-body rod protein FlgC
VLQFPRNGKLLNESAIEHDDTHTILVGEFMNLATSLSGLDVAAKRLANSANNVANINSTAVVREGKTLQETYLPKDIVQISQEAGGAAAYLKPRTPATVKVADPDNSAADENGLVDVPNVNLEEEVVQQQMATYDFKANLKALKAQDEMEQGLLDIKV